MEYRKGQSLKTTVADFGPFHMVFNETTEAYRLNGVTVSKGQLARVNQGSVSREVLFGLLVVTWPLVNLLKSEERENAKAWRYLFPKFRRIYQTFDVAGENNRENATKFARCMAMWVDATNGNKNFSLEMAAVCAMLVGATDKPSHLH